jgi:hypothetical protein
LCQNAQTPAISFDLPKLRLRLTNAAFTSLEIDEYKNALRSNVNA